jgi:hypothetical protein
VIAPGRRGDLARRLHRLERAVEEEDGPRGLLPSADVLRRMEADPEWREEQRRESCGEIGLAEIDGKAPRWTGPVPPEADKRGRLIHAVRTFARRDLLVAWAAARLGMPVLGHDLCGPGRALVGTPAWDEAREALPALLRDEARKGDTIAAGMLADLDALFADLPRPAVRRWR